MNRVVNYARSHVSETLDLGALADVACLSKYHFSRVFNAHFGETPTQFLARIRLELAARKMVFTQDHSITQIAMDCGFSGSDTFARSFRTRFGSAPRLFRASNQWSFDAFDLSHPFGVEIYKPEEQYPDTDFANLRVNIELRPEYQVAYIRHVGPYGDVNESISRTFATLQRWAEVSGVLRPDTSYVGLFSDSCSTTPARHCIYDACISLTDEVSEDDVVSVQTIPAATYAVVSAVCRPMHLNSLWLWLTSSWLPQSGRKMSFRPRCEVFARFGQRAVTPEYGVKLCLPLLA